MGRLAHPRRNELDPLERGSQVALDGAIVEGLDRVRRLVRVDQKPIGRTRAPTWPHLHRLVRPGEPAVRRHPGRAPPPLRSGPVLVQRRQGPLQDLRGRGRGCVELLFMPSVYAPCPSCHGARYNAKTLEIELRGRNIAQVLAMTVDAAAAFFAEDASVARPLQVLREVGLGYLRLGQPATELSGGEAQRIKLATERQRAQRRDSVVRAGRAHHRAASVRCRYPDAAAAGAGGRRQHGAGGRARHARGRGVVGQDDSTARSLARL